MERSSPKRLLLLSKIEEEVETGGRTYFLGTNEYQDGTIHPAGFIHLQEFRLIGKFPTFIYAISDVILEKVIWMARGQNTTYIRYSLTQGPPSVRLSLKLFANYRHY